MANVNCFRRSKCPYERQLYKRSQSTARATRKKFELEVSTMLPAHLTGSTKRKVLAFCRLLLKYERKITPCIHRAFEATIITWNSLIEITLWWKNSSLEEEYFPSFVLNACRVLRGEANSFVNFPLVDMKPNPKGQRYFGNDIW